MGAPHHPELLEQYCNLWDMKGVQSIGQLDNRVIES